MTSLPGIAGIVLAAGGSARMGAPKSLLELEGETFLARAVRVLREGGCDPVLVVVPPGEAMGPMGGIARTSGAQVIENPDPAAEQIDSLRLGLEAVGDAEAALVLPVDVLVKDPEVVRALCAAWREQRAPVARPVHGGRPGHPVLFARETWEELATPDLEDGARDVVHRHLAEILEVEVGDPGVLVDIDTPEEYVRRVEE
jgi:CTP:molybdopterin cytidylyltransferase MocA